MGPTLILTTPRYSSPSTSRNCAPGRHGAIRSMSVRTAHAFSTGTATSNSLISSIRSSPVFQVFTCVDVAGNARAGHFVYEFRVSARHRSCTLVSFGRQHRPDHGVEAHRMTTPFFVRGEDDRSERCRRDRTPRRRRESRHVTETDHRGAVTLGDAPLDTHVQRGRLAERPVVVL